MASGRKSGSPGRKARSGAAAGRSGARGSGSGGGRRRATRRTVSKGRGRGTRSRAGPRFSARLARLARWLAPLVLVALTGGLGYVAWLDAEVRTQFEGRRWTVPARIYARPLELYPGLSLTADALEQSLSRVHYRRQGAPSEPGTYSREGSTLHVATREFRFWDGPEPARRLRVSFREGRVQAVQGAAGIARLEPEEIGRIFPAHHEDRMLVRLDEVPRALSVGLVAVEDRRFHEHHGVSLAGVARAAWANLRAGAAVQGGSTLTQQLAKNFFLTPERTWSRKAREALIAVLIEAHYPKDAILEAYLNEIFLGQAGRRAVHGVGAAARFYFGKPVADLALHESALLVALARGASQYDPRRHPDRARARRDLVLSIMAQRGVVDAAAARRAASLPLGVVPAAGWTEARYPAFVDLVRRQLRRDYRDAALREAGLRIFTTLDPVVQERTERSLASTLALLERSRARAGLEGAVVVVHPPSGEVSALVGGRDPLGPGFNRALDAVRPIGSLVKPAVYLAALERPARFTLASVLDDAPVRVPVAGAPDWTPRNYDGRSHGQIALRDALAQSYNLATVRLGLSVGLPAVTEVLRRLGVRRPVPRYPSVLLGALALAPVEVAQMYQTLANGGFRVPLRAIRAITDARGTPLARYALAVEQAVEPGPAFLITDALQEVARDGTARSAYATLPRAAGLAGKTGTTDGLRDSWFAGFSGDRLAVVWLGRDDNRPAKLSGASGALRVWVDLMAGLPLVPLQPGLPEGVAWHWVSGGSLSGAGCPGARRMPFVVGSEPARGGCGLPLAAAVAASEPAVQLAVRAGGTRAER